MAFKYGTTSPTAINYDGTSLTVLQYGIDGYDVLDYIEFSGTQFIRTGISSLTTPYSVETTFNKTNTSTADQCLFGQRQLGKFSNIYNTYFENDPLAVSASNTVPTNKKSTLVVTNTSVSIDGTTLVSSSDVGNRSTSYEALIGAFSEDSYANAKWFFQGRIYEMKIINAGVLYRHFIPTMRKSDNVVGLYDKLNNVFYTNSGSGSFVAGNNIKGYPVWGKPYSLSISAGANTSVTITRTSSPNQHASTGTLSSGSVIYYGDVLTITASVSSGYKFETFTVNGTNWTSGNTITVTSAISVVTTAVASASWKTVWTGTKKLTDNVTSSVITPTQSGFSGMNKNYPTRITGYFNWYEENTTWSNNQVHFKLEKGQYLYQNTLDTQGHEGDFTISNTYPATNYCFLGIYDATSTALEWAMRTLYSGSNYCSIGTVTITKIEQYY